MLGFPCQVWGHNLVRGPGYDFGRFSETSDFLHVNISVREEIFPIFQSAEFGIGCARNRYWTKIVLHCIIQYMLMLTSMWSLSAQSQPKVKSCILHKRRVVKTDVATTTRRLYQDDFQSVKDWLIKLPLVFKSTWTPSSCQSSSVDDNVSRATLMSLLVF